MAPPPVVASDVIYEATVNVAQDSPGKSSIVAPAWTSQESAGGGNIKPTEAHHRMLHEASVLSSHISGLRDALTAYSAAADTWFAGVEDFNGSTGYPAAFRNRLAPEGAQAVKAAAAAAQQLAGGGAAEAGSAFAPPAAQPAALSDAAVAPAAAGAVLCPSVAGTPALGAATSGLTEVVPADVLLPKQHEALFSHEVQRRLVVVGRSELKAAISDRLMPSLDTWLEAYDQAKSLLPDLERCWQQVTKARYTLEEAKADILTSEAEGAAARHPGKLSSDVPVVLMQGPTGGQLIAEPDRSKRQQLYKSDAASTDAELNFELLEKVLRVRLQWLMEAGAGIKALLAAAMAHALRAAAAEGDVGQSPGGTAAQLSAGSAGSAGESPAAGLLRASKQELLEPFPEHVLATLRGEHLPLLQQVVSADHARLARWGQRYRAAMAAGAAADAAAAGATMMAAAAGAAPVTPAAAGAVGGAAVSPVPPATPGLAVETGLHSTDEAPGAAAGTAAGGLPGTPGAAAGTATAAVGGGARPSSLQQELAAAAAVSGLPVDLLAAAVAADVQESEVAAAASADKRAIAQRLLHDASVVGGKETAVLLPLVAVRLGQQVADRVRADLERIEQVLADMGSSSSSGGGSGNLVADAHFDLKVLEVLERVEEHYQMLEGEILPALGPSSGLSEAECRHLAGQYRKAAAAAPTRPHGWFLGTAGSDAGGAAGSGGAAGGWLAAAGGAAGRVLAAPARAGVRLVDAAADIVRFGPGGTPSKG